MEDFPKPIDLRRHQSKAFITFHPHPRTKILTTILTVLISVFVVTGAVFAGTTIGQYISIGSGTPDLTLGDGDLYVTGTLEVDSDLAAKTGGTATFVVAASDASDRVQNQADYVADGTADDVEIQAAIDALPAGGGKVVLSEGTFNVDSQVSIGKDNVTLEGIGESTILKVPNSSNLGNFSGVLKADTRSGIHIKDLVIDGNQANQSVTHIGIYLLTTTDSRIEGVTIKNMRGRGIWVRTFSQRNRIANCRLEGNRDYSVDTEGSSFNAVANCTADLGGDGTPSVFHHLFVRITGSDSQFNTVVNNTATGGDSLAIIVGSASLNTLLGNTGDGGNRNGIYVDAPNNSIVGNAVRNYTENGLVLWASAEGSQAIGNIIDSAQLSGLRIGGSGGQRRQAIGNTIRNSQIEGIHIDDDTDSLVLANHVVNSVQNLSVKDAINVDSSTGTRIKENFVDGTTHRDDIRVEAGGTDVELVENKLAGNGTGQALTNSGTTTKIHRNAGWLRHRSLGHIHHR